MLIPVLTAALALAPPGEEKSLAERLSFDANGRLRGESTFDQLSGEDRHRGRLRLRIGAVYEILPCLRAYGRLSTSSDGRDANNAYWDFGDGADGFQGVDLLIDRFFLDWDPTEELELRAGKLPHAFTSPPVYGEFVWDQDVHPAGVTAKYAPMTEGDLDWDLRLAEYVVTENGSDDDANMLGVQGNLGLDASESTRLALATGVQWWSSLDDGNLGNQGNTTTGGSFDEDFTVWESHLSAMHDGGPMERQVGFVQYAQNLDDDSGEDTGYAVGFELGRKDPGKASVFAAWYDFEADSIFSPVAQDDTPIAGTGTGNGINGVLGGVGYVVSDTFSVRLWALTADADDVEDPWRVRLDLDFSVR